MLYLYGSKSFIRGGRFVPFSLLSKKNILKELIHTKQSVFDLYDLDE